MDKHVKNENKVEEYAKPEISDYGDLKELTASSSTGSITDVPKGFPAAFS